MKNIFENKNIAVTGGTGAFGSKFVNYLVDKSPAKVTVLSRDEMKHAAMKRTFSDKQKYSFLNCQIGDINRAEDLEIAFAEADIVVHAAAMKHLPECEANAAMSNYVNVFGTQNVIRSFHKSKAQSMVFLSTDKAPYASSIYGAQKYIGEKLTTEASGISKNKRAFSLRYSNVIDSTGAVFLIFANMLSAGRKVSVNGTQTLRGFVTQADVISTLEASLGMMHGGETVVLKPRVIRIAELATAMQEILGKGEVEIKETSAFLGEKDNATLIMAEEMSIARQFPNQEAYILDYNNLQKECSKANFTFEGAYTLDHCPTITGPELKEYLKAVMKSNNML